MVAWQRVKERLKRFQSSIRAALRIGVGSVLTWNYEIFSIVAPPVAKQPSLTSFIRGCISRHSIFHVLPFLLLCAFLKVRGGTILIITVHCGFNVVVRNLSQDFVLICAFLYRLHMNI